MFEKLTFDLDDLDRDVLVAQPEQFEVAVTSFTRLGVTVDLDAEVVSVRLPVQFALCEPAFGASVKGTARIATKKGGGQLTS